jgi:hypothetical protein
MRTMLYLIIFFLLISGCATLSRKKVDISSLFDQLELENSKKDFLYSKLSKFDILNHNSEILVNGRKPINEKLRNTLKESYETLDSNNNHEYLYSLQKATENNYEFTTLSLDKESCEILNYIILNKEGTVSGKFIASSNCADGGWRQFSYGKFLDVRTYEKLSVEFELVEVDKIDDREIYEGDSTINHFVIDKNGRVTVKEISNKHFRHKWIW